MTDEIQGQMARWTAGLAALLGAAVCAFLLQPLAVSTTTSGDGARFAGASAGGDGRTPAAAAVAAISAEAPLAAELDLACDGPAQARVPASVKTARLSGHFCLKGAPGTEPSSTIRNEANGFAATAFFPRPKAFTTDYISLSRGINRISIAHAWRGGLVERREFSIERAD